jgi:hypothetical protein
MFEIVKIPEHLKELNAEYESLDKDIISLENSLADYKAELEQLREKHNAEIIECEIKKKSSLQRKTFDNIIKVKYKYVAELVLSMLNNENLSSYASKRKDRERFFKWLSDTHGIIYEQCYHFTDFETFYNDYIDIDYKNIDISYDNVSAEIYAEYYFRGECDDKVKFIIPRYTLNKIDTLADEFNQYLETIIKEKEEVAKANAIKTEQQEYAQFLRLKEKFGDK